MNEDLKHRFLLTLTKHRVAIYAKNLDGLLNDLIEAIAEPELVIKPKRIGKAENKFKQEVKQRQQVAQSKMIRKNLF